MHLKFEALMGGHRPVIEYDGMLFLFDSGASVPVWCYGLQAFQAKFAKAAEMEYQFVLSGFGRSESEIYKILANSDKYAEEQGRHVSDVYSIPDFTLKSGTEHITWKNLNVAVTDRKFGGVHMILPYTMFGGMTLSFIQETYHAVIDISSSKTEKHMFVRLDRHFGLKLMHYVYSQDE